MMGTFRGLKSFALGMRPALSALGILVLLCSSARSLGAAVQPVRGQAVVVGVADYPSQLGPKLRGPRLDAANMSRALAPRYDVSQLIDGEATRAAVLKALREAERDDVLFYFSGHSSEGRLFPIDAVKSGDERAVGGALTLVDLIQAIATGTKPREVVIILDGCRADDTSTVALQQAALTWLPGTTVAAILGAGFDSAFESLDGGVFTNALLKSVALADKAGDGSDMSLDSLVRRANTVMAEADFKQQAIIAGVFLRGVPGWRAGTGVPRPPAR